MTPPRTVREIAELEERIAEEKRRYDRMANPDRMAGQRGWIRLLERKLAALKKAEEVKS